MSRRKFCGYPSRQIHQLRKRESGLKWKPIALLLCLPQYKYFLYVGFLPKTSPFNAGIFFFNICISFLILYHDART
uniref:Uncharacterized protein n=1 Tax=Nyssomyia neivai TaxID=330878 RepID=A0A1L8D6T9_9DIPT